jgi:hypothetical protein
MRTIWPAILKQRSRYLATRAKQNGELVAPKACENCSRAAKLEMHHPDYSKPLDVIWLCKPCHGDLHLDQRRLSKITTNRMTVTNRVDFDLWKEVKHQAIAEGRAITYILEAALRAYLAKARSE